jgi:hypothetical protein
MYNPEKLNIVDVTRASLMILDTVLEEDDGAIVCGIVFLLDYSNTTLAHMMQFTPSFAKKAITLIQVSQYFPLPPCRRQGGREVTAPTHS